MNKKKHALRCGALAAAVILEASLPAPAFPPTPCHTFYGMVRDEVGDPIASDGAVVVLETSAGVRLTTTVAATLGPGMNYRLQVPMDAGLTSDAYRPTALRPLVPFSMKVVIGTTTYLPLELKGSYANLGKPAESTQLDLTLGEDADGDGLPDAWERMLIEMSGQAGVLTVADIRPGDDADGDGMSNLQEYIAGTYAFDSTDSLRLEIAGMREGRPLLDFLVIRGRTYTIQGCTNLASNAWTPIGFRVSGSDTNSSAMNTYSAQDVRMLRAEADLPTTNSATPWMFRLQAR